MFLLTISQDYLYYFCSPTGLQPSWLIGIHGYLGCRSGT